MCGLKIIKTENVINLIYVRQKALFNPSPVHTNKNSRYTLSAHTSGWYVCIIQVVFTSLYIKFAESIHMISFSVFTFYRIGGKVSGDVVEIFSRFSRI